MSEQTDEILRANAAYVETFGDKGSLAATPARRLAILTCMDARIDPDKILGLKEGDAHIIRNAGGRVSNDAIRSLVVSHRLLGTQEWLVIHHTDCGMGKVTDQQMAELLSKSLDPLDEEELQSLEQISGSRLGYEMEWRTISEPVEAITEDVTRLRQHPLVPPSVSITAYIYDVHTGKLNVVPEANAAGMITE